MGEVRLFQSLRTDLLPTCTDPARGRPAHNSIPENRDNTAIPDADECGKAECHLCDEINPFGAA